MTNVSKRHLSKRALERLFGELNAVAAKLNESATNDFFHDLLGAEERVMLAKRLAIIVMVAESYSTYRIADKLKVSTSTVDRIKITYERGGYNRLLRLVRSSDRTYLDLWVTLDSILHLGGALPHYGQTYSSEVWKRKKR